MVDCDQNPSHEAVLQELLIIYNARCHSIFLSNTDSQQVKSRIRAEVKLLKQMEKLNFLILREAAEVDLAKYELAYSDIVLLSAGIAYLKKHDVAYGEADHDEVRFNFLSVSEPLEHVTVESEQGNDQVVKKPAAARDIDETVIEFPQEAEADAGHSETSVVQSQQLNLANIIKYMRTKHCVLMWINIFPLMVFALFWIYCGYESKDLMTRAFGSILLMVTSATAMFSLFEIKVWEKQLLKDDGKKVKAEFLQTEKTS